MEAQALVSVARNPKVEDFAPGDTVRVSFRVREGESGSAYRSSKASSSAIAVAEWVPPSLCAASPTA